MVEQIVNQASVGIKDSQAESGLKVGRHHVAHEGCLAGAGLAEDGKMLSSIAGLNLNSPLAFVVGGADRDSFHLVLGQLQEDGTGLLLPRARG